MKSKPMYRMYDYEYDLFNNESVLMALNNCQFLPELEQRIQQIQEEIGKGFERLNLSITVECTYIPIELPDDKNKEIETKLAKLKKDQCKIEKAIRNLEAQKAAVGHQTD